MGLVGAYACARGEPQGSMFLDAGGGPDAAQDAPAIPSSNDDATTTITVPDASPVDDVMIPGMTTDAPYCGDGMVQGSEGCDDGNSVPGDGCSGTCQIEPGWYCPVVGQPCKRLCGNGQLDPGEPCDLGPQNGVSGSGCTIDCQIAPGFACGVGDAVAPGAPDAAAEGGEAGAGAPVDPEAGAPDVDASGAFACFSIDNCGNGRLDPGEECDSGPLNGTGGCTASCKIVPGWRCSQPGFACLTVCGDAIVAGDEQCDFGTANGAGGCSASCVIAPGFACMPGATLASQCHATTCGDGVKEGLEECDDGNRRPYDGCSPFCAIEPACAAGTCTKVCGDGQVSPGEQCDDGNTVAGDGCSPTCTVEPGWTCNTVTTPPGPTLVIPILYRDMHYCNGTECANNSASTAPNALGMPATPANGHPDFNRDAYNVGPSPRTGLVSPLLGVDNEPVFLSATGDGTQPVLTNAVDFCWWYHDVGCTGADAGAANPFAMGVWLDAAGNPLTLSLGQLGGATSYVYQYNNQAFFPIDGLGWNDPRTAQNPGWFNDPQTSADCSFLADGGMAGFGQQNFSFTSELHYRFTYQAAVTPPPTFTFTGDDDVWTFVNGHIFADLGGMHDHLTGTITLDAATATTLGLVDQGIYSIDVFQAERHTCRSTYQLTVQDFVHQTSQCTALCGSGLPAVGKQCDLGTSSATGMSNNTGGYGGCNADCTLAPYCGDGTVQTPPEACDLGASRNTGAYGGCNPNCTLGPYCGDGIPQSPQEQCDLGAANNTGGYGGCNADCTLAPYCGDGLVQSPPEQCDQGTKNVAVATAYGPGLCTTACTVAPFCGDGVVQSQFGEQCDGTAGCSMTCQQIGAQ